MLFNDRLLEVSALASNTILNCVVKLSFLKTPECGKKFLASCHLIF